ncbi:S-4TM family putative pore-forming effector [Rhizobium sp. ZW T2_16]|uniref:S-4TM family putative pore-forming effector n=1 Tax=Rhizobium sp. ZW T2_16 TaxID=3378083 RepID=UPI00385227F7
MIVIENLYNRDMENRFFEGYLGISMTTKQLFDKFQNDPSQLRYLQARRSVQANAGRLLCTQLLIVVAVPTMVGLAGSYVPGLKAPAAIVAIFAAWLDIFVLDRLQKRKLAISAKLQEEFDCNLFDLKWNPFVAGTRLDADVVNYLAKKYVAPGDRDTVRDWYPRELSRLPHAAGRLAAQILNLGYDSSVRSSFRGYLVIALAIIFLACLLISQTPVFDISTLILGVIVPLIPFVNWGAREAFRQHDAIKKLGDVSKSVIEIWEQTKKHRLTDEALDPIAREIQNANYLRRSSVPMVWDKIYWLRRPKLEAKMVSRATELVGEYLGDNR